MEYCKTCCLDEIKDESIRRAYAGYESALAGLKACVTDLLEKVMAERLGELECDLSEWSVVIYEDESGEKDWARTIYKGDDGRWMAVGLTAVVPFDSLPAEKVLGLYKCFEKTIAEIDSEK